MKRKIIISIIIMGFSGLIAEILLLRELLIVFSGNELCIGIILANWLLLEALGCIYPGKIAGKTRKLLSVFIIITILFSFALVFSAYSTRILKNILGISIAESVGLITVFYSSFLILLPVSILHGSLFTFSCKVYSKYIKEDSSSAGKVYVFETIGTLLGGIVSTYLLIPYINTMQAFIGLAFINFLICFFLIIGIYKESMLEKALIFILIVLVLVSGFSLFSSNANRLHYHSIEKQWRNQNIIHYQNSHYGNICIIENNGQYIYFIDGMPSIIMPIPNIPFIEEFVHLPLLAHNDPSKVLLLGGGAGGIINEVLMHSSIDKIDYAELDPLLISLFEKYPTSLTERELNDERVNIQYIDGVLYLKTMERKYDLIFIGTFEPANLQANRFFTKEFLQLAKTRLNEDGILVMGLTGSLSHLNPELRDLNSSIFHTMKEVFPYIRVIPGDERNLFLSSGSSDILSLEMELIMERLFERDLGADAIMPWHIERKLHERWQDWFMDFIEDGSRKTNHDFRPLGLFYNINHWNSLYAPGFGSFFKKLENVDLKLIFLIIFTILLINIMIRSVFPKIRSIEIPYSIITTGFSGMIFSLILIFAFQSIYGYVFSWIGILISVFMAGAAIGAGLITEFFTGNKREWKYFVIIEISLICISIIFPFILNAMNAFIGNENLFLLFKAVFLLISFICGFMTGSQFPLGNILYKRDKESNGMTGGLIYAFDLLGGYFGGILGAVLLLPVLGLAGTSITVVLLKLSSLIFIYTNRKICI